ncbi:hypothetical protein D3C73_1183090 [compost metagenome]
MQQTVAADSQIDDRPWTFRFDHAPRQPFRPASRTAGQGAGPLGDRVAERYDDAGRKGAFDLDSRQQDAKSHGLTG